MKPLSRSTFFMLATLVLTLAALPAARAQSVQVDSANPSSAEQGTVDLEVEISGSGFDNSATVDFFVTGTTNPGGIQVKNVKTRGSKKIIATIDVADGATVDDFDIEVRLSSGRKGKGTTLFSVQAKPTGKPADEYYAENEGVQFISPSDVAGFDYHIIGTPDRDDIYAGGGRDLMEGGATRDYLYARANDDVLYGGDGGDILEGEEGNDILYGEAGDDRLNGGQGTDLLYGGDGEDILYFSLGRFTGSGYELDVFDGGAGIDDSIDFHDQPDIDGVVVDLASGTYEATVRNTAIGDIVVAGSLVGIETAWGSEGDDLLLGTSGDDGSFWGLYGSGGNDVIYGYAGNDILYGGHGDDVIYGGPGDDLIRGYEGQDILYGEDGDDFFEMWSNDVAYPGPGCDAFSFRGSFGTHTIMDFDDACEYLDLSSYNPKYRLDFNDLDILISGSDIVISFWFKKQGGAGGTIVLKDGVTNGVVIDPSNFVF